ncbi:unnamed protein product [Pylaiella littoralis]
MMEPFGAALAAAAAGFLLLVTPTLAVDLRKIQQILDSSAPADFAANPAAFKAASSWHNKRLLRDAADEDLKAPYIGCADYGEGRRALASLENTFGTSSIHRVSNSDADGSCFIVTASTAAAAPLLSAPESFGLLSAGPFLPSMKLATSLLDHGSDSGDRSAKLRSTYGDGMALDNVRGLSVRLSPGTLPVAGQSHAVTFIRGWHAQLMSESVDVKTVSFWSDPDADRSIQDNIRVREWRRAAAVVDGLASKHGRPVGEICNLRGLRMRHVGDDFLMVEGVDHLLPSGDGPSEAKMACFMSLLSQLAAKPEVLRVSPLHGMELLNAVASAVTQSATTTNTPLFDAGLTGVGEVIQVVDSGLDETSCFFADDDGLQIEHGHLFDGVRKELDGNVSIVSGNYSFAYDMSRRKVVQYIDMFKRAGENDSDDDDSSSTSDSLTYASEYLEDLYYNDDTYSSSYSSEYLADSYYNDDTYSSSYSSSTYSDDGYYVSETLSEDSFCAEVLDDFSYHFSFLFDDTSYYSTYSSTSSSTSSPYSSASFTGGFHKDNVGGHGTWCAGIAAGSISAQPGVPEENCHGDESPGCVGGCVLTSEVDEMLNNGIFDLDLFCPMYDCDGDADTAYSYCLSGDPAETLYQNSGAAAEARIAVFDVAYSHTGPYFVDFGGNLVWESATETGAKIHSNSWGGFSFCELTDSEYLYDTFMYENPESLLIFVAGNEGGFKDDPFRTTCTVRSPGLGKNVLTVGATSSGPSRATGTGTDGRAIYETLGLTPYSPEGYPWICEFPILGVPASSTEKADIDTVAWFSSYGPTKDNRIKPEVVAPGDQQVFSAWADGTEESSCKLVGYSGTSASCPVVAGSAALVRQYFKDQSFYTKDLSARGLCDDSSSFQCSSFAPSAATVKAILINSANLMGGSSEPDQYRGFGRVHLEAGMPMDGTGALGLLVADSSGAGIASNGEVVEEVNIDGDAGIELRATLCWIDPPTTALSAIQLQHDLDLVVTAPSGATHTMWGSGVADTVNVVERVVVLAESMESGVWRVRVSAKELLTDEQSYSLVVTGAIRTSAQGL